MALCLYMHLFCVAGLGSRASHVRQIGYSPEETETVLVYAVKLWHSRHT